MLWCGCCVKAWSALLLASVRCDITSAPQLSSPPNKGPQLAGVTPMAPDQPHTIMSCSNQTCLELQSSILFYSIIWWVVCFLAWKIYPMNKLRAMIDVNASSHAMRIGKENKTFLSWKSFYNNYYYSKRLHTREEVAVLGTVVPDPLSSCQVE